MDLKFDLLSGKDMLVDDIYTVRQLTLQDIKDNGYDDYMYKLDLLLLDQENFCKVFQVQNLDATSQISLFDLITYNSDVCSLYLDALSLFIREKLEYAERHRCITVIDSNTSQIHRMSSDEYEDICDMIKVVNGLSKDVKKSEPAKKKQSALLAKLHVQMEKGRAQLEKSKSNVKEQKRLELWNIMGSVCAYSPSYNFTNIMGLTVYQLYDQFSRLNKNYMQSIATMRWCIWGEDQYDVDPWYALPHEE